MRQGQQNRRGRGRNNNNGGGGNNGNRKGQNPLTRSFESNGPDMKIRGTPAHIAEKYVALARDAQASGDPVLAENYLQHAEHYNRIIMTYRDQQMSQGGGDMGGLARPRPAQLDSSDMDEFGDESGDIGDAQPQPRQDVQAQPSLQPHSQGRPYDGPRYDDRPQRQMHEHRPHRDRHDRGDRNERGDRGEPRHDRHDRYSRPPRDRGDRGERGEYNDRIPSSEAPAFLQDRQPSFERANPERAPQPVTEQPPHVVQEPAAARAEPAPRRRERFAQSAHEQPEFLRRPVRRPRRDAPAEGERPAASGEVPQAVGADEPNQD